MSQSLAQIFIHVIFSTKNRSPYIKPESEKELYAYIGATINRLGGIPILINGTKDHIHILSTLPRTVTLSKLIEEIKRNSSRWIKTKGIGYKNFSWQRGYGAFSVSSSNKDTVRNYIKNQKEHHRSREFKEEFVEFLNKYGVEYDEKYVWD